MNSKMWYVLRCVLFNINKLPNLPRWILEIRKLGLNMSYFSYMNGWIQKCVWKFIYELKKPPLSKRHTLGMCTKDLRTERVTQTLTRGANQLKPSDLVLVLHCGSGPYSDFMAKILGVNTLLFAMCHHTSHIIHLGFKSHTSILFTVAQWYWLANMDGDWRSIPMEAILY